MRVANRLEASLAGEEQLVARAGQMTSPYAWLFWVVLVIVAAVLLLVIARMLPKNPPTEIERRCQLLRNKPYAIKRGRVGRGAGVALVHGSSRADGQRADRIPIRITANSQRCVRAGWSWLGGSSR